VIQKPGEVWEEHQIMGSARGEEKSVNSILRGKRAVFYYKRLPDRTKKGGRVLLYASCSSPGIWGEDGKHHLPQERKRSLPSFPSQAFRGKETAVCFAHQHGNRKTPRGSPSPVVPPLTGPRQRKEEIVGKPGGVRIPSVRPQRRRSNSFERWVEKGDGPGFI